MYLDFSEIPSGDDFENFAMLLLEKLGLRILVKPASGPDGGRDIIAENPNNFGSSGYRWLVSCKNFSKSGRAVGINDDKADINKLKEHNCHGFMFVYSTNYTEDLRRSIERACQYASCENYIMNGREIEQKIISTPELYPLIQQFMPGTHNKLIDTVRKGVSCCKNPDDSEGYYLIYTTNQRVGQVEANAVGMCCISSYANYYDENQIPYDCVFIHNNY